jgi:hypothetical protein
MFITMEKKQLQLKPVLCGTNRSVQKLYRTFEINTRTTFFFHVWERCFFSVDLGGQNFEVRGSLNTLDNVVILSNPEFWITCHYDLDEQSITPGFLCWHSGRQLKLE